jgi:PBP1b-binding outer membrane lipoprotein LpoB
MKKIIIWLVFVSLIVSGCSNLWEVIECVDKHSNTTFTLKAVWETNKRILVERGEWWFKFVTKSQREDASNCSSITEDLPPKILSWYDSTLWDHIDSK